jgi:hypothetical protein
VDIRKGFEDAMDFCQDRFSEAIDPWRSFFESRLEKRRFEYMEESLRQRFLDCIEKFELIPGNDDPEVFRMKGEALLCLGEYMYPRALSCFNQECHAVQSKRFRAGWTQKI